MIKKVFKDLFPRRSGEGDPGIGAPSDVINLVHVEVDPRTGEVVGLPDTWMKLLKKNLK